MRRLTIIVAILVVFSSICVAQHHYKRDKGDTFSLIASSCKQLGKNLIKVTRSQFEALQFELVTKEQLAEKLKVEKKEKVLEKLSQETGISISELKELF